MDAAAIETLVRLEPVRTDRDMPYLPLPNRSDLVLTAELPPVAVAPTAFLLPFLDDGSLVMVTNRRRGRVEIPGGHREPGETSEEAAIREAMEETGCEVCDVRPIGFQRLHSEGVAPAGYNYPFPLSFQQYFVGRVVRMHPIESNDEVLQPTVVPAHRAEAILTGIQLTFHRHAFQLLFSDDHALQGVLKP